MRKIKDPDFVVDRFKEEKRDWFLLWFAFSTLVSIALFGLCR